MKYVKSILAVFLMSFTLSAPENHAQEFKQLYCSDLRPGDILLKMATNTFTHKVIVAGQKLVGQQNAFLAHAAIVFDTQFAIEAQKVGITANHLGLQNKDCGYYVYRCTDPELGQGAATIAKILFDANADKKLKYNTIGAGKSVFGKSGSPKTAQEMEAIMENILSGKEEDFFCSQFVVFVYQYSALQSGKTSPEIFNISDTKASPSVLASLLQNNPWFKEIGYMMPGERSQPIDVK
jgi:hypothetical protein